MELFGGERRFREERNTKLDDKMRESPRTRQLHDVSVGVPLADQGAKPLGSTL